MNSPVLNFILVVQSTAHVETDNALIQLDDYIADRILFKDIDYRVQDRIVYLIDIVSSELKMIKSLLEQKSIRRDRFIFILHPSSVGLVRDIIKKGFLQIFVLPDNQAELVDFVQHFVRKRNNKIRSNIKSFYKEGGEFYKIIGTMEDSRNQIQELKQVSRNPDLNILIRGEVGSGQTELAKAIHNFAHDFKNNLSELHYPHDPNGQFLVKMSDSSGSITYNEIEDDYKIFTSIPSGTLLIENIGYMEPKIQKRIVSSYKLYNQQSRFHNNKFRIISTYITEADNFSNEFNLERDLFLTISNFKINIVPLRYRKEDLILLLDYFILETSKKNHITIKRIENEVYDFLLNYQWPGNIHELSNAVFNGVIFSEHGHLTYSNFSKILFDPKTRADTAMEVESAQKELLHLKVNYLETTAEEIKRMYCLKVLHRFQGNKSKAAKILGISRPTLIRLIQ